jgi:hypothetical protein
VNRNKAVDLLGDGPAGVNQWNRWREMQGEPLDLAGIDLGRRDLTRVNLSWVGLRGANLAGAVLRGAELVGTHLTGADLTGADLTGADLTGADLTGADLTGADLSRAICWSTVIANIDLTAVRHLSSVRHLGPSLVGADTLFRLRGTPSPGLLRFLRGCGVPDALINELPRLLAKQGPVRYHSCFISHSSVDKPFVAKLHRKLNAAGVNAWFDAADLVGGQIFHDKILRAIQSHDRVIVVLSRSSMRSRWVKAEIQMALKRKRDVLLPIRLVDLSVVKRWAWVDKETAENCASRVRERHLLDFTGWADRKEFDCQFKSLLRALRADN